MQVNWLATTVKKSRERQNNRVPKRETERGPLAGCRLASCRRFFNFRHVSLSPSTRVVGALFTASAHDCRKKRERSDRRDRRIDVTHVVYFSRNCGSEAAFNPCFPRHRHRAAGRAFGEQYTQSHPEIYSRRVVPLQQQRRRSLQHRRQSSSRCERRRERHQESFDTPCEYPHGEKSTGRSRLSWSCLN